MFDGEAARGGRRVGEATRASPRLAPVEPHGHPDPRANSHICLIYERITEARAAIVTFFTAGLAAGERCLYLGDLAGWRRVERALAAPRLAARNRHGHAPDDALDRIRRAPRDDAPWEWLELIRDAERRALAAGFTGLRVSWETLPAPGDPARLAATLEMEQLLERALSGTSCHTSLLCRYSRQRSPAAVLRSVIRGHPAAMFGGEAGNNPFYEPPQPAPGTPPLEARVEHMLSQLRRDQRRERRVRDLERRLADRGAELRRADEEREQLISVLAHELRNPLSTVSVALEVLRQRGRSRHETDETWERALDAAERQVFHQAALVDDLLEAARVTRGQVDLQREPLDLCRLVPDVVDAYRDEARQAGLGLEVEMPHEPLPVSGDRLRLWQSLAHLLQNAVKFSPRGGRLKVQLRRAAGDRAEIVVRDSGVGIAPELLPHVFETFTQADHTLDRGKGGLGVGLAVVKGLIELHGGEVRARSDGLNGQGSEFTLVLPLDAGAGAELGRQPAGGRAAAATAAPRRVLVIEDNVDTAATLRDFLELSGFDVAIAFSGGEGVETAGLFHPEIVLCDLGLPGMNGFEVAAALRRDPATAAARLIALTGYGGDEDRRRSHEAGFEVHLTKPVDPPLLRRLLSGGAAAAERGAAGAVAAGGSGASGLQGQTGSTA
jgi:signal transduction histidine kinase/ActR/RegA family two-component response regulator